MKSRLYRRHFTVSVGTASQDVVPPNPSRFALMLSVAAPNDTPLISDGTLTSGADTSTTGVKSSYVVPAGVQARLKSATMFETTGTTVVSRLQIVRGGTTYNLATITNNGSWIGDIPLQAGDTVQWNVTTAVALSVTDYTINVDRERVPARVTVNLVEAAVLGSGIDIIAGNVPVVLSRNEHG